MSQQVFGQISAILAGHTGNEGFFSHKIKSIDLNKPGQADNPSLVFDCLTKISYTRADMDETMIGFSNRSRYEIT
jgi:hypothetical protein